MIEKPKLGEMRTLLYLYDKEYQKMVKVAENEIPVKITFEEFVELVKKMRHQQRRYFATRNKEVLEESKKLEQQVDSIISKMNDRQLNLF